MLTREYLRQIIDYEPKTGFFRWKIIKIGWRGKIIATPGDRAGHGNRDGYWQIVVDGERHFAHRLAWLWMTGHWPFRPLDHIDRDKGNNQWANLRQATPSQNALNSRRRTREELAQARKECLEARAKETPLTNFLKKHKYLRQSEPGPVE